MAKRKVKIQLDLFDPVQIVEDEIWSEFKAQIDKLHKEGFRSIDEGWWRSRYYEGIICPGHQRNRKGFEHEQMATKTWRYIWNRYKKYITNGTSN